MPNLTMFDLFGYYVQIHQCSENLCQTTIRIIDSLQYCRKGCKTFWNIFINSNYIFMIFRFFFNFALWHKKKFKIWLSFVKISHKSRYFLQNVGPQTNKRKSLGISFENQSIPFHYFCLGVNVNTVSFNC